MVEDFIKTCEILSEKYDIDLFDMGTKDTIESLLKKNNKEALLNDVINDLNENEINYSHVKNMGYKLSNIKRVYNGERSGTVPTKEEVEKINDLGISLEKNSRNVIDEFINTCSILKNNYNVDLSKITIYDNLDDLFNENDNKCNKKLLDLKNDLKSNGIRYKNVRNIGPKFNKIKNIYNGKIDDMHLTQNQIKELKDLGIELDSKKKNITDEFIDACRILRDDFNVDIKNLKEYDTIESLLNPNGEDESKVDEFKSILKDKDINYESNKNIGIKLVSIRSNVRGLRNSVPITEKQLDIIQNELGLRLKKRNAADEVIDTLRYLRDNLNIDISKINHDSTLDDILNINDDVKRKDIENEFKEIGLNYEDVNNIGHKLKNLKSTYRDKNLNNRITDEQLDIIQNELGIKLEKRNTVDDFINVCKVLKDKYNIDLSIIKNSSTLDKILNDSDVEKGALAHDLKELGINYSDVNYVGSSLARIRRQENGLKLTESERHVLEDDLSLRIKPIKRKGLDVGKASFDLNNIKECDIENNILNEKINEAQDNTKDKSVQEEEK